LTLQFVPELKKQRMYPAANACLLPDPVINLQPPPFVDSQLEMGHLSSTCTTYTKYTTGYVKGTHIIAQGSLTQGSSIYSVHPPPIMVQQEPSMLGEIYNVLQQMKLESDRLVNTIMDGWLTLAVTTISIL
jgi:hypothetical protein